MNKEFKPAGYNSVSPYFVVNGAQKLMDLLIKIFDGKELRKYSMLDGSIMHAEIQIDDSVLMFGEASEKYPANQQMIHVYVSDVDGVYKKAIAAGCTPQEEPKENEGDPDRRGSFLDFAGNMWSVGMQVREE